MYFVKNTQSVTDDDRTELIQHSVQIQETDCVKRVFIRLRRNIFLLCEARFWFLSET